VRVSLLGRTAWGQGVSIFAGSGSHTERSLLTSLQVQCAPLLPARPRERSGPGQGVGSRSGSLRRYCRGLWDPKEGMCWSCRAYGVQRGKTGVRHRRAFIGSKGQRGHTRQRGEAFSLRLGIVSRTEPFKRGPLKRTPGPLASAHPCRSHAGYSVDARPATRMRGPSSCG
jgi:hypothetical protein